MSQDNQKFRVIATEYLTQFIEAAIHCTLLSRDVYPSSEILTKKRFGVCVRLCAEHTVRKYVRNFLSSIRMAMFNGRIHAVCVLIRGVNESIAGERFVVEIPNDFARILYHEKLSSPDQTELELACIASHVLSDAYRCLERRLGLLGKPQIDEKTWEVYIDIKQSPQGSEMIDVPVGCILLDNENEDTQRESSCYSRLPLKSSLVDDSVLLVTYIDIAET